MRHILREHSWPREAWCGPKAPTYGAYEGLTYALQVSARDVCPDCCLSAATAIVRMARDPHATGTKE